MTDTLRYYRPKPGLQVRDPDSGGAPLPAEGKGLTWSSFWQRRLDDGDIEPTDKKAIAAAQNGAASKSIDAAAKGTNA